MILMLAPALLSSDPCSLLGNFLQDQAMAEPSDPMTPSKKFAGLVATVGKPMCIDLTHGSSTDAPEIIGVMSSTEEVTSAIEVDTTEPTEPAETSPVYAYEEASLVAQTQEHSSRYGIHILGGSQSGIEPSARFSWCPNSYPEAIHQHPRGSRFVGGAPRELFSNLGLVPLAVDPAPGRHCTDSWLGFGCWGMLLGSA